MAILLSLIWVSQTQPESITDMKAHQFVAENRFDPKYIGRPTDDMEELAARVKTYIDKNCQPWLRKSGGRIVYRGMGVLSLTAFTRAVRSRRKPVDSGATTHRLMNMMIQQVGGVANRSNSAFVTSDYHEAGSYGSAYIAMPVGNFNYTWSPVWTDWQQAFDEDDAWEDIIDYKKLRKLFTPQQWAQQHREYLDRFRWAEYNKREFVQDATHRMFHEILNTSSPTTTIQYIDPGQVKKLIVVDKNLSQAIEHKCEIMIHCEKMLYIDEDFLQQVSEEYYDNWIKTR